MPREERTTKAREPSVDNPQDEAQRNGQPTPFQKFEDFVKKIAQVPKEEVDELRAERKREKDEDF